VFEKERKIIVSENISQERLANFLSSYNEIKQAHFNLNHYNLPFLRQISDDIEKALKNGLRLVETAFSQNLHTVTDASATIEPNYPYLMQLSRTISVMTADSENRTAPYLTFYCLARKKIIMDKLEKYATFITTSMMSTRHTVSIESYIEWAIDILKVS
jgi:hypothetical protein